MTKGVKYNMADDEYRPPEEAVSDAPDMYDDENDIVDDREPEKIDGKCPNCGSPNVYRQAMQTSPDDYTWEYTCQECGATWED